MTKILIGQLAANGDCAYATVLARQLRHDHPDAHLTWAISSSCAGLLKNNPHVDDLWEIPARGWNTQAAMWRLFEHEAFRRYQRGEFDEILLSQVWPDNLQNFDGTVRPCILRSLGRPVTVPIETVLRLTDDEIERVDNFAQEHDIANFEHRILFECESRSGQSFITPDLAQEIATLLYELLPTATVIFSTIKPMTTLKDQRSRYAGQLSLREIAQLTHACTAFVGAGSGGTVIATSSAAKPLPTVLLLKADTSVFASFAHDLAYFQIDHPGIVETADEDVRRVAACIARVCREGPDSVLAGLIGIPVNFEHYRAVLELNLLPRQGYLDAARSLLVTAGRYGWTEELIQFGRQRVEPNLTHDPSVIFTPNRMFADRFRAALAEATKHPASAAVQISAKAQGLVG